MKMTPASPAKSWLSLVFLGLFFTTAFAQDTLYVGIYNEGQILRYDQTGTIIQPDPWIGPGGNSNSTNSLVGEGIAVGEDFPTTGTNNTFGNVANPVYIANFPAETIEVANGGAASGANPIVNATFITGLSTASDIALSPTGQYLYVAQGGTGTITEYNALTGAYITSVSGITDAHDVCVGANGTVYVTAYAAGTAQSVGVIDFSANLTNKQTFIAEGTSCGTGTGGAALTLTHATGMVFDSSGDLWVANAYTVSNSVIDTGSNVQNFVSEFSSTGVWMRTIESGTNGTAGELYTVFGLSLGSDGNIYAASFNGDQITEINTTTYATSPFINLPAGDEPKYAIWSSDAVAYVPEPASYSQVTLGAIALLIALRLLLRRISQRFRRRDEAIPQPPIPEAVSVSRQEWVRGPT